MKKVLMAQIANKVIDVCIAAKEGEQVLIVTEPEKISIAESIATAAHSKNIETTIVVMIPRDVDGQEPPTTVAAAMKESDAFIAVVGKSITHTHAVKNATENGSRGIVLTQFSEDMMIHGGMEADFAKVKPTVQKMADSLAGSENIRLTTELGTDLTFSGKGRRGNAMYCMVEKGEFAPAPTVEANVSPLEGTAQGKIVADASIPYIGIGLLDEPVNVEVKDGMMTSITGGEQARILREDLEAKNDKNVYNIAELGVGLNPDCRFIGLMLEDEGVYGSVHIGIGTNITLGGNVKAASHYDLIMKNPTIEADGKILLKDGEVMI